MEKTEQPCEHPEWARAAWATYKGPNAQHNIGWACAQCGHVEQTGETPGKPIWLRERETAR